MITIGIVAGHGGNDTGAVYNGIIEKDLNFFFAMYLAEQVRSSGLPVRVFLIRDTDKDISLSKRGQISKNLGADFVVSIHINASKDKSHHGLTCFHWPGDEVGRIVSETICRCSPVPFYRKHGESIFAATDEPGPDDDWLQRPRNVLEPHAGHSTPVLVEIAYMSNPSDAEALGRSVNRSAMIPCFMAGIARYRQLQGAASWPEGPGGL